MLKTAALITLLVLSFPLRSVAAGDASPANHDFDWNFGTWRTHIRALQHPFSASAQRWVAYDGIVTVRPLLGGAANVEEIDAGEAGQLRLLNVRTFDPRSQQWIENQSDAGTGMLAQPAFGTFSSGRGTFYDTETYDGRTVLVRQTFFDITASSYAFEQALSTDGGATWQPNFRAHLERTSATVAPESAGSGALSHDFDFNDGTWRTSIAYRRAANASSAWGHQTGTVTIRKVLRGRGLLEEIVVGGPDGFTGLTLYLYNPQTREWSQTYADSSDGTFGAPMTGRFSHGRGELFTQTAYGNRTVLQRGMWSDIRADAHHFEIDVSDDGGAVWRPIFVAALTRIEPHAIDQARAFDYQTGTWQVQISRLLDPGSASPRWARYSGTHVVTPLLGGVANAGVLEVSGPAGSIEGLQLRTYDPATRQWHLSFASGSDGIVQPPSVGSFTGDEGRFYDSTRIGGRLARVRTVVTRQSATAYRDVISYSTGGSAWHDLWIASYVKASDSQPLDATVSRLGANRDFDFQIGTWHVEMDWLARRLAGSHDWRSYSGSFVLRRLWDGRANVGWLDVHNGADRIRSIILRTYDPQTREWSDYSVAVASASVLFPPAVGRFRDGRGELYDRDTFDGKPIAIRYAFDDITARSCRFTQSFSADDGKTWEPNMIARFMRAGD